MPAADDFGAPTDPFLSDAPDRRRPPGGWPAAVGAVAVAALLAGIAGALTMGGRPRPQGAAASTAATTTLGARLLEVTDMAPGWSLLGAVTDPAVGADAFGGASSFVTGCLTRPVDRGRRAEAEVEMADGDTQTTVLSEAVADVPGGAKSVYGAVVAEMSACPRAGAPAGSSPGGGVAVGGPAGAATVRPVAVTGMGAPASAWVITAPSGGEVVVASWRRSFAVIVAYGSPGAPDTATAFAYARRAVAKLG